jgi:hypothetical protein
LKLAGVQFPKHFVNNWRPTVLFSPPTDAFLDLFDMYLFVFSVFGQYVAIQPAECGHQNEFWSTGVRRAALRTV